jgi:hypothetical protein
MCMFIGTFYLAGSLNRVDSACLISWRAEELIQPSRRTRFTRTADPSTRITLSMDPWPHGSQPITLQQLHLTDRDPSRPYLLIQRSELLLPPPVAAPRLLPRIFSIARPVLSPIKSTRRPQPTPPPPEPKSHTGGANNSKP